LTKLAIAEKRLNDLLSIKEWAFPTGSLSNATAISGTTIATTYPVSSPVIEVAGNLDDFFSNLTSSFEMLGQTINLVHIDPPLNKNRVTFYKIVTLMRRTKPAAILTANLNLFTNSQWFKDMKGFRKCSYHQKKIPWKVSMEYTNMQATFFPQVSEILVADNPFSNNPTYTQKRNIKVFCLAIFQSSLITIDKSFEIMEIEARNADRIPV